jgi:phage shock protein E
VRSLALALLVALLALPACSRSGSPSADAVIQPQVLAAEIRAGEAPLILDVRSPEEYASGHVPGAVNIPYDQMPARVGELGDPSQEVVVYCETGGRAAKAEASLQQAGFKDLRHLEGDMRGWRSDATLPCSGC